VTFHKLCLAFTLTTVVSLCVSFAPSASADARCPNELIRSELGMSGRPDCRAWEMVSPLDKNGGNILGIDGAENAANGGVLQASPDGQKITYASVQSFVEPKGAPYGSQYVSSRDASAGWSTQNISPPMSNQSYEIAGQGLPYRAFSQDLSVGLLFSGERGSYGVQNPPLAPGAPAGYENDYLYGIPGGAPQPLLTCVPALPPQEFRFDFLGATPDLSHSVVRSSGLGECGEPNNTEALYDWESTTGKFQPVSVLPGGSLAENVALGGGEGASEHAISEDGSTVIWTDSGALYVREALGTSLARTVQADASQGGPEPGGGGGYRTASSDGSKVLFTDASELTSDANTGNLAGCHRCGADLYEFDATSGQLRDLTVDHSDANGAEVQGVVGASADGSYVYFVADGVLAPGASPGNCRRGPPAGAVCNLYLWHEGWETPRFIAALSDHDQTNAPHPVLGTASDWSDEFTLRTAVVARDGLSLVFMSKERLNTANFPEGYDNTVSTGESCGPGPLGEPPPPAQCEEVFLYQAAADRLSCVSCNPSGARPTGPSGIPGATKFHGNRAMYRSRVLSEGEGTGRVFFDSADALTPQDTNGAEDVYEYQNRHTDLLSDGHASQGASFVDASIDGNDAFFITHAQLVPQDTDHLVDLYDARVGGGFPLAPAPVCTGTGCQGLPSAPPVFATPSSATFNGAGNFPPPAPAKAKTAAQIRAALLAKALTKCRVKHNRHKRAVCEAKARKRYGAHSAKRRPGGPRSLRR
jgi:hypothetical protein